MENEALGVDRKDWERPSTMHSHSDPIRRSRSQSSRGGEDEKIGDVRRRDSLAPVDSLWPSPLLRLAHLRSYTTSRRNSITGPSPDKPDSQRRPSMLSRLKSSISTSGASGQDAKLMIHPSDFRAASEYPEKRFIDSVGMVIPGVCDRIQCLREPAHFVFSWRLCEPLEYTTALADHGITFTDYSLLLAALEYFLGGLSKDPKRRFSEVSDQHYRQSFRLFRKDKRLSKDEEKLGGSVKTRDSVLETAAEFKRIGDYAAELEKHLADITWNLRARGVPVMVCVGSFSLFSPNRISEAHVQVLHVPLRSRRKVDEAIEYWSKNRSPDGVFVDPFRHSESACVSFTGRDFSSNRRSRSPPSPMTTTVKTVYPHQQQRDRSIPWPIWPNAIPVHKRGLIEDHAEEYGADPYFRAWVRADINSHTPSSYAKYMIEREDDPFINKRMTYVVSTSRAKLWYRLLTRGIGEWKQQYPSIVNRGIYEHNRRLEARKSVELGYRVRLARFAFRHAIFPAHTPEMEKLGLTSDVYRKALSDIEGIRERYDNKVARCPLIRCIFRKRGPDDAIPEMVELIKKLNSQQRGVVWTCEGIPGVYERGMGRCGKEWEISVWNGEDPLELLLQLERCGIIEKRLTDDDDGE
ncbi:hypothetical protein EJ04DRAFT_507609 [Polyplosphaeria fusca]|uniref:Uncharacterized protein n=1 Tax=Polyplosphaeria fusca TaxID=682080 RepID=A0A9P4RBT5_9PLEO|nr:hypothetical protein EJ04DRAFT_507609 [Polyplosphaeria fusca]